MPFRYIEDHEYHLLLQKELAKMNEIKGHNIYCGPAVIAAVVGCNTDTAERYIQSVRDSFLPVKGVSNPEIIRTFELLGYNLVPLPLVEDGSLFGAIPYLSEGIYLFNVPEHYILIEVSKTKQVTLTDNHTKTPIKLAASARLSQNVEHCWRIDKVKEVKPKEVTYSKRRVTVVFEVDTRLTGNINPIPQFKGMTTEITRFNPGITALHIDVETITTPDD